MTMTLFPLGKTSSISWAYFVHVKRTLVLVILVLQKTKKKLFTHSYKASQAGPDRLITRVKMKIYYADGKGL